MTNGCQIFLVDEMPASLRPDSWSSVLTNSQRLRFFHKLLEAFHVSFTAFDEILLRKRTDDLHQQCLEFIFHFRFPQWFRFHL